MAITSATIVRRKSKDGQVLYFLILRILTDRSNFEFPITEDQVMVFVSRGIEIFDG